MLNKGGTMSRKTIVLADNSYTIRRIVELSFSDETDIELVTFENGLNLKEKLLELRPQIILVDIKLPEFNGYEVCKFVQGSELLTHTKIFLLKGGFEPIDENLLQNLKFENIITKPFDSNALVSNIKKILEEMSEQLPPGPPVEMPSSLPEDEDLPDIEPMPEPPKEISFSDVKEEIDSEDILTDEDELIQTPGAFSDDEVLPSEEITRAQPDKDTISPSMEEEDNPFAEDVQSLTPSFPSEEGSLTEEELNIKHNIEMQEKELEIDSLTLEEINIKRDIERQERELDYPEQGPTADMVIEDEGEESDVDASDMFPQSKLEAQEDFFSLDDRKSEPPVMESPTFDEPGKDFFPEKDADEPEIPDIKYETDIGRKGLLDFGSEPVAKAPKPSQDPPPEGLFPPKKEEIPEPPPAEDNIEFESERTSGREAVEFTSGTEENFAAAEYEIPDLEMPPTPHTPPVPEVKVKAEVNEKPEPAVMDDWDVPQSETVKTEEDTTMENWETPPDELTPPSQPALAVEEEKISDDWDNTPAAEEAKPLETWETPEEPEVLSEPTYEEEEERTPDDWEAAAAPETPDENIQESWDSSPKEPEPYTEPTLEVVEEKISPPSAAPEPVPESKKIPGIQQEAILNKIEDKLTRTIKEMLWEIVPPLAEKIIKEEIKALSSETEKAIE
jgi:DNA-binding response OmpR family regulator